MSVTGPALVYGLCFLASLLCAGLLVRSWLRTRTPLLFWSALCFVFLAVNNMFLLADLVIFPTYNLVWARQVSHVAAVGVLIYGFIWEADR